MTEGVVKLRRYVLLTAGVLSIMALLISGGVNFIQSTCRSAMLPVSSIPETTVILDAGHGGEDGGAVAADGTNEKDINLQIAEDIALYFELLGIPYRPVREGDNLIGDNSLGSVRERKVSDIRQRMAIVNEIPDALLLSIHQNYYPVEKYHGTQVFYAKSATGSKELADSIQAAVRNGLQADITRQIKPTEGTVYLLDKAEKTSVMVECGFLSNPAERDKLKDQVYQTQLSYYIVKGLCEYFNNSSV